MKNRFVCIILATIAMVLLASCSAKPKKYRIGISQCSEDIWRDKQNAELRMGAYLNDDVELRFAAAYDSDERQVQQIDSLTEEGIDLLIVAPNQVATITPAIDRVYDRGIPVIVFERKTNSKKYTAHIGADNYEMGRLMGEYAAQRLGGKGRVMEVMGLKGSSPAIERHNGFAAALKRYPAMQVVTTLQGDWTEETAYKAVEAFLRSKAGDGQSIELVFGQNDRMAMGARKAFAEVGAHPLFFGIDGLPGEQGGIRLVRDSLLDATYIYPTHGDQLLQLAMNILEDKPYEKENKLMSALVTRDNANVLLMQSDEMVRQTAYLDQLHQRANSYVQQLANQRLLTLLTVAMLALLLLVALVTYLYYRQNNRIRKEREQLTRDRLNFYTQVSHELRTPLTLIEGPLAELSETNDLKNAGAEATGLLAIVRRNTTQLTQLINKMLDMQVKNDNLNLNPNDNVNVNLNLNDNLNANNRNCQSSVINTPSSKVESEQANENVQTVLIVDDNADIRAYLRTILQDKYQVNEAADGQQGLALANEIVPDIVVSDVMMPVMNGLEFCQRLKSGTATSHIPVILLTARALSNHQVEGYESGADAYITKPFASEVLLARISNLLRNRLLLKDIFTVERNGNANLSLNDNLNANDNNGQLSIINSPLSKTAAGRENAFLARFCDCIDQNLADSDLSVETVGAELGLSRVQLYRKVKALTGLSPVELLLKARLQRGLELLQTTDKTISEVAYEVGFTAPSYFTKCFRDEYGIVPGESRK